MPPSIAFALAVIAPSGEREDSHCALGNWAASRRSLRLSFLTQWKERVTEMALVVSHCFVDVDCTSGWHAGVGEPASRAGLRVVAGEPRTGSTACCAWLTEPRDALGEREQALPQWIRIEWDQAQEFDTIFQIYHT